MINILFYHNFKKIVILLLLSCLLIGCSTSSSQKQSEDILTQKETEEGRTQITMLSKHAFTLTDFEKKVEEEFSDIDLVLVGDYTVNAVASKGFEARIENDDLTDIISTWPYEIGQEYWSERLIDMSGMSFTNQYKISMLDSIANKEGNLYYLPGPASIRGIVYNKTMFEENGWKVPQNYNEFASLCKTIEASGNRAFQLPLGNAEVLDTAFIGFNYGTAYSKPDDVYWLSEYDKGNGTFIDHFDSSLDTFQALIDDGIIKQSDLDLTYANTQENLYNRKTVMTEDSIQLIKLANTTGGSTDEYAIMPFFNRNPENTWARLYMTCFIGMNQHLLDKGNEEKYEKVIKVMEYISTSEGQAALSSGNGTMFSSLKDATAPMDKELLDMRDTLEQGRYGVFPTFKLSAKAFREGLKEMLKGNMNKQEVAILIDKQNMKRTGGKKEASIGKAKNDFTFIETGNFVADVMRKTSDCDFALMLDGGKDGSSNGRGISAKLYKGNITETDLYRILPDYRHNELGEIWKVQMKGKDLIKTLEYSIEIDDVKGWFYYFSGFKMTFDPVAKMGSRIKSIETINGKKIEKDKVYTIAVGEGTVPEEYVISTEKTSRLIVDELKDYIQSNKTIEPSHDQRFIIHKSSSK